MNLFKLVNWWDMYYCMQFVCMCFKDAGGDDGKQDQVQEVDGDKALPDQ